MEVKDYHLNRNIRNTLVNIAGALNKTKNLSELFGYIQKYLDAIIDAKNFFIALYNKDSNMLKIIYGEDEKDKFTLIPLEGSLTGYIIKTGKSLLINEEKHKKMIAKSNMKLVGSQAKIWLGVPLKIEKEIIGVVVVQSYEDENLYGKKEMRILEFVSGQIAIVIDRKIMEDKLRKLNEKLEEKVVNRTEKLHKSLKDLEKMQEHLVESEKMAALGNLVAGVAHEINTPVGVGVTAASHLQEKTELILKRYKNNTLKRSDLEEYLNTAKDSAKIILANMKHASENISSFKKVAVDQTKDEKRIFNVKQYLSEILISLHPKLKKTKHIVEIDCSNDIELYSFPGAFSQIITNLVMNSLIHAFKKKNNGTITIQINNDNNFFYIKYEDDGIGISEKNLKKIFEPFFTTNRIGGGTGLGLHVVYNIVTHKLNGMISCESIVGKFCRFNVKIPLAKVDNNE